MSLRGSDMTSIAVGSNEWISLRLTAGVVDTTWANRDNCRNAIALPGGRTALIGSGGLTANDALFGGALATNGNRAMFAGFNGGGTTPSATSNDDSYVVSPSLP